MKTLFYTIAIAGLMTSLTGCLNDNEHLTDFQNVGMVAEIPSSAFYGIEDNQGLLIQTTPISYGFDVNIASPNPPAQDITVTLAVDKVALDKYNAAHGTTYQLLPPALYQLPGLTATVKAGSRLAPVKVSFFTGKDKVADPSAYNDAEYALPLRITSASNNVTVSSNFGTKIIFLKIKNEYDGEYRAVGTFTHPTSGARKIDRHKTLATIDLNTVETEFADLGGSGWLMRLRVNPDKTVTLIPAGAASTATIQFGVNKYDPITHAYTLNYKYAGGGGDRVVSEVITRE